MKKFEGIKYSKATKIYYKFIDGILYKKVAYRENGKWEKSDYKDINKMSKNWIKIKETK